MDEPERRQRILLFSPELLIDIMTPPPESQTVTIGGEPTRIPLAPFRALRCERGLPAGTRCVGVYWDHARQMAALIVQHESFEPVKDGDLRPVMSGSEIQIRTQDPRLCCWGHECPTCRKES